MEKVSKEIKQKAKKLLKAGKVKKDLDSEKRSYFTVEGESEKHSVIFEKREKGIQMRL